MSWKTQKLKRLAKAFLSLKTEAEMLSFLRDICTLEELSELSGRWEIAQMLNKGESYRAIAKATGVSTTTVTRIAQWLGHGMGGYKIALSKLNNKF